MNLKYKIPTVFLFLRKKIPSWERIGKTSISGQKGTNTWNAKNGFILKPFFLCLKQRGLNEFELNKLPTCEDLGSLFQSFEIIL